MSSPGPTSRSSSPSSDNDVFSMSHSLVPERVQKSAGTTTLAFDGLLSSPLILHEDLHNGCGGQLWPAGMTLAKYILSEHRTSFRDKHIIEIGAGGGLVGLAVALGCDLNRKLLLTDQQPMLGLMHKNINLNKLDSQVFAQVYDWGSKAPSFSSFSGHPDVVLAADCVYFEPAFPLLLQTLDDLIGPNTTCYFCFKKRRKADLRFIKNMMKKFEVGEVQNKGREADRREGIHLFMVTSKGQKTKSDSKRSS